MISLCLREDAVMFPAIRGVEVFAEKRMPLSQLAGGFLRWFCTIASSDFQSKSRS